MSVWLTVDWEITGYDGPPELVLGDCTNDRLTHQFKTLNNTFLRCLHWCLSIKVGSSFVTGDNPKVLRKELSIQMCQYRRD